ncbi:hypothetical protein M405DRAFT_864785 [Rhizopogon salebrosus TDB-379]|nr:hypothetical protein M405DRAFT_864785 [Rhizopogon salebrosus TDB-379]
MSKKLQSGVLLGLLAGKDYIFQDPDTIHEIYGLGEKMFDVRNKHLTENQRMSLQTMIKAVEATQDMNKKFTIMDTKASGWAAGQEALKEWFVKQKVSHSLYTRADEVWKSQDLLPIQLIQESGEDGFPELRDADSARDDILLEVFGTNALSRNVRGDFRRAIDTIMHHSWERHRKMYGRIKNSIAGKAQTVETLCSNIENAPDGCITPAMVRAATNAVKRYAEDMRWFPLDVEMDKGLAEHEAFLKEVVITAVAKVKQVPKEKLTDDKIVEDTTAKTRGAARARRMKNVTLAAAGDVDEIWALYTQYFTIEPTPHEALSIDVGDGDELGRDQWDDSDDQGVQLFRHLDDDALNRLLRFPEGRPTLFAEYRSKTGKCSWDADAAPRFVKGNDDMQPLALLWHQRVGIASIVDKVWLPQATSLDLPGILIADDVGVGKTGLAMGILAFIMDAYWVQELNAGRMKPGMAPAAVDTSKVKMAPILGNLSISITCCRRSFRERASVGGVPVPTGNLHSTQQSFSSLTNIALSETRPFFAGQASIPNLPHVIIVLGSLIAQWCSELRTFFAARSIEIYFYPTAEKEFDAFWTGHWAQSKVPLIHRIILVPHSVMTTAGKCFDTRKGRAGGNAKKASDDKRKVRNPPLEKSCLWSKHDFLTVVVDEAHEFRNINGNFYAILEVCKRAVVKIAMTATPLYTSPKDLCNIGRLLRIPDFIGTLGDEHEQDHFKLVRAARRVLTAEDKELAAAHTISLLSGKTSDYEEPVSKREARRVTMTWVGEIKKYFGGRVIRRTVDSKRYDGKKINDTLPPYKMIIVPIHLFDDEQAIISEVMAQITGG